MKMELDDIFLNDVNGGTVIISADAMVVGFSSTREIFPLKNCTYREARDYRDDLIDENPQMTGPQFDAFCREQFRQKGWI